MSLTSGGVATTVYQALPADSRTSEGTSHAQPRNYALGVYDGGILPSPAFHPRESRHNVANIASVSPASVYGGVATTGTSSSGHQVSPADSRTSERTSRTQPGNYASPMRMCDGSRSQMAC